MSSAAAMKLVADRAAEARTASATGEEGAGRLRVPARGKAASALSADNEKRVFMATVRLGLAVLGILASLQTTLPPPGRSQGRRDPGAPSATSLHSLEGVVNDEMGWV